MNSRITCTLLSIVTSTVIALSQNPISVNPESDFTAIQGEKFQCPLGSYSYGHITPPDGSLFKLCFQAGQKFYLTSINEKLESVETHSFDITNIPKKAQSEGFYFIGTKFYWFYSAWVKKGKKDFLYVQEIDLTEMTFKGNAVVLSEFDKIQPESDWGKVGKRHYGFISRDKYNIRYSHNSSYLMFSFRKAPKKKNDAKNIDEIGFVVVDSMLNTVSSGTLTMPYTEEQMDNVDLTVDEAGNACFLAKVYDGPRKQKNEDGSLNYHFEAMWVKAGTSDIQLKKMPLNKPYFRDAGISNDEFGKIVFNGLYANDPEERQSEGYFHLNISSEKELLNEEFSYIPFPADMLKSVSDTREKRSGTTKRHDRPFWSKLRFRETYNLANSGKIIMLEEYYEYSTSHTGTRFGNTYTYDIDHHQFHNIYLVRVDSEGSFKWWQQIPKTQTGKRYGGTMSFRLAELNGNYYFLYLDHIENKRLEEGSVPSEHVDGMGGILTYTKIDDSGKATKVQMFDQREFDVSVLPRRMRLLGDSSLLFNSFLKKTSQFIRLDLE